MEQTVSKLLRGENENHILPFLWLHGEDEETLRDYMRAIDESAIGAVCVESRPHPDFCGPGWWLDMDIILDEAQKRNMKVWILDDSHFPTGYANGAMAEQPEGLCRRGICYKGYTLRSNGKNITINIRRFIKKSNTKFSLLNIPAMLSKEKRHFSKDVIVSVTAIQGDTVIDLTDKLKDNKLICTLPKGVWQICLCKLSFKCGVRRNYINMLHPESCRVLIDAVYEPHFERYGKLFGSTIAGFFSDEPELGNSYAYANDPLGTSQDLPWSDNLPSVLEEKMGADWKSKLPYLWENNLNAQTTAEVRFAYMDAVTALVQRSFSEQIGGWCREHGVQYIGHMVEDNNAHSRTGGSLGHYFRGLWGQDMAGIDDIGGQVYPQGEEEPKKFMLVSKRDGEFYHYCLDRLGASLAALDSKKNGNCMCEIFGNYGWSEGLRLEKFLADHFMVNGVNYFVPHAFSAKKFPDPDCPPHFYAGGNDPQYRHFRYLMEYMNRVCRLISGGRRIVSAAVLYQADGEWSGKAMLDQKVLRELTERQINADIVPADAFSKREAYHTDFTNGFCVNTQKYAALIVPFTQFIGIETAAAIQELTERNVPVIFVQALPEGMYNSRERIGDYLEKATVLPLEDIADYIYENGLGEISPSQKSFRLRYLHYQKEEDLFYFFNEDDKAYHGDVTLPVDSVLYAYNAWDNRMEKALYERKNGKTVLHLSLEPSGSLMVITAKAELEAAAPITEKMKVCGKTDISDNWRRSICRSLEYPHFQNEKTVALPDRLYDEKPHFSGWVKYRKTMTLSKSAVTILEITDAYEGAELFINGESAGVQIVPPYRFDISKLVKDGKNDVTVHISTTLERERAADFKRGIIERVGENKVKAPTGITGKIYLYQEVY